MDTEGKLLELTMLVEDLDRKVYILGNIVKLLVSVANPHENLFGVVDTQNPAPSE